MTIVKHTVAYVFSEKKGIFATHSNYSNMHNFKLVFVVLKQFYPSTITMQLLRQNLFVERVVVFKQINRTS